MAVRDRGMLRVLAHGPFLGLGAIIILLGGLLLHQASRTAEQSALALAGRSAARAALALKGDMLTIEARLRDARQSARASAGITLGPLPAEIRSAAPAASAGQFAMVRDGDDVLAFLVPAGPGAPTAWMNLPASAIEDFLVPLPGTALRLFSLGGEPVATRPEPEGIPGGATASLWVLEGSLGVEGIAQPSGIPAWVWFMPALAIGALVMAFRERMAGAHRSRHKLGALRAGLARHAAQLSVNEARMRLSQSARVAVERRDAALIEAWPRPAALIDLSERLCAWNESFAASLPEGLLRRDLQLGMLLRHLDTRTGPRRRGPQHPRVRIIPLADGSRLIEGVEETAQAASPDLARGLCRDELEIRAPLLRDAVLAGRLDAAREIAHAMRGLASNFALLELTKALETLERAEEEGVKAALAEVEAAMPAALQRLAVSQRA